MYDVIIVGAGPAGLSAGIRLKLLDSKLRICILEKANTIGGHLISGTILQKSAYVTKIKQYDLSSYTPIAKESIIYLNKQSQLDVSWAVPISIKNEGNVLLSINELCRKMCEHARQLGVSVLTKSGVTNLIINDKTVIGVVTVNNTKMLAKHTILAEGAGGVVTSKLIKSYNLKVTEPQTYALGIREEWEPIMNISVGTVWHTIGWPAAERSDLAGGFVYAYANNVAIGYVTHLNYNNSYLCPYNEFLKFKSHPLINKLLVNNKRVKYGARIISTGGINAIPEICYNGCTVVGCSAGLVNVLKLKGVHNAILSGENAAENFVSLSYKMSVCKTTPWILGKIQQELCGVRNVCKMLKKYGKIIMLVEQFAANTLNIKVSLLACRADSANNELCSKVRHLPHDWELSDSRNEALKSSKLSCYSEVSHLDVSNNTAHKIYDLRLYDKLSTRLCPAKVYAWIKIDKHYEFKIQHDNCIQCKSCCVKLTAQTVCWCVAKEGGGPNYN